MLAALCLGLSAHPVVAQKFHCEADTTKAMEIIREFHNPGGDPAKICSPVASPAVGSSLCAGNKRGFFGCGGDPS